jgi:hypothetical protein
MIAQTLLNDRRAVLGITDMLVHPRGTGVQWNPADQLCVAGQVLCRRASGGTWTLSGQIHAVEQKIKPDELKKDLAQVHGRYIAGPREVNHRVYRKPLGKPCYQRSGS